MGKVPFLPVIEHQTTDISLSPLHHISKICDWKGRVGIYLIMDMQQDPSYAYSEVGVECGSPVQLHGNQSHLYPPVLLLFLCGASYVLSVSLSAPPLPSNDSPWLQAA